jgi:hypothetical protein
MGTVQPIEFENYEAISRRFYAEVSEMQKEEERK